MTRLLIYRLARRQKVLKDANRTREIEKGKPQPEPECQIDV